MTFPFNVYVYDISDPVSSLIHRIPLFLFHIPHSIQCVDRISLSPGIAVRCRHRSLGFGILPRFGTAALGRTWCCDHSRRRRRRKFSLFVPDFGKLLISLVLIGFA